jgi:hypothetical protein
VKRIFIVGLIHFLFTIGCIIALSGLSLQHSTGVQVSSYLLIALKFLVSLFSNPMQPLIKIWAAPKSLEFIPFLIINSLIWAVVLNYLLVKWRFFRKST